MLFDGSFAKRRKQIGQLCGLGQSRALDGGKQLNVDNRRDWLAAVGNYLQRQLSNTNHLCQELFGSGDLPEGDHQLD